MATQTDISDIIDDNGTQTAPEDTATKQNTQQSRSNSIDGEWEKKYKGLQGVIAKRDAEIANLRSEVSTNQITIEEQKQQISAFEKKYGELDASLKTTQADLESHKKIANAKSIEADRLKLVAEKHPELLSILANGLMPEAATDEEFMGKIEKIGEQIAKVASGNQQNRYRNSSPTPSGKLEDGKVTSDINAIYTEMDQLAGTRDPKQLARYNELQQQLDLLTAQS